MRARRVAIAVGLVATFLWVAGLAGGASAAKVTRFWNLTANTVTAFALAPAGTDKFGPDLTKADKDGAVDHDERLKIPSVASGTYDVKLSDSKGRQCIAKNIVIKEGDIFTIDEKQIGCAR